MKRSGTQSLGTWDTWTRSRPPPAGRELDPHETGVERLFLGFVEVLQFVEALRNIAVYIRRFPYRGLRVDKGAYLRYHVENYLNELYILQERMKGYVVGLRRQTPPSTNSSIPASDPC